MTADPFRRTILLVILLNLSYFGLESVVAARLGSVSLFADSVDFLEDASVNLLILLALGWSARQKAHVGMALAAIMLLPAIAFLWTLVDQLLSPAPPPALPLSLTGAGALAVNLTCAVLLARHRHSQGSLVRAAFLSARNDVAANVGIIAAGLVTALHPSIWPDILVGVAIAWMNLDAAREVWDSARQEQHAADAARP